MSDTACHPVRLLGEVAPDTRVRRPDRAVGREAALADGLAAADAASAAVVARLLPAADLDAVALRGDDAEVIHARPGIEVLLALVGADVLDEVLARHDWSAPRLRPMRDGQDLPYGAFAAPVGTRPGRVVRAQVGRLVAELTGGATVSIDGVDEVDARVEDLAAHLERRFGARVLVNAYLSGGDTSATRRHWDDHDVIVLQLEGSKHWEVRRPVAPAPLRGVVEDRSEGGAVCWEGTLSPGDTLFVPRGHPHVVTPTGDFSLHLTAGITRARAVDVLHWLPARAPTLEGLRRDLHPAADGGDDGALERLIAEDLVAGAVGWYRALSAARRPARAATRFSSMRRLLFTEERAGLTARLALPGGLFVEEGAGDELVVAGAGRRWALADHAVDLAGRLLTGAPVALDDLVVDCPSGSNCARTLVAQWAVDGIVAIDRGEGPLGVPSVS